MGDHICFNTATSNRYFHLPFYKFPGRSHCFGVLNDFWPAGFSFIFQGSRLGSNPSFFPQAFRVKSISLYSDPVFVFEVEKRGLCLAFQLSQVSDWRRQLSCVSLKRRTCQGGGRWDDRLQNSHFFNSSKCLRVSLWTTLDEGVMGRVVSARGKEGLGTEIQIVSAQPLSF